MLDDVGDQLRGDQRAVTDQRGQPPPLHAFPDKGPCKGGRVIRAGQDLLRELPDRHGLPLRGFDVRVDRHEPVDTVLMQRPKLHTLVR